MVRIRIQTRERGAIGERKWERRRNQSTDAGAEEEEEEEEEEDAIAMA
jgi:hypothetical protein